MSHTPQSRPRVVVETSSARRSQGPSYYSQPRNRELWVGISVVAAAAFATFLALFLTSRPYDPMSSTVAPQQVIPQGPVLMQSPKTSPTPTPEPTGGATPTPEAGGAITQATPDDTAIQSEIEKALAADAALAQLDISILVESGRVTIVGSVRSGELKQRVGRMVRSVKGVVAVDNHLVVVEPTP